MSEGLKRLVNTPDLMDAFRKYVEGKIVVTQRTLEQVTAIEEVYRHQGAINAYRKLLSLRDEINYSEKQGG